VCARLAGKKKGGAVWRFLDVGKEVRTARDFSPEKKKKREKEGKDGWFWPDAFKGKKKVY